MKSLLLTVAVLTVAIRPYPSSQRGNANHHKAYNAEIATRPIKASPDDITVALNLLRTLRPSASTPLAVRY
jgi:hypothetical protein